MQGIWRIGLTGGIGSGKSTVAALLAGRGAAVIDADAISRQATASGGAAIDAIRHAFGADFITPDGALDRERMRSRAFADPAARRRLETIVHPLVSAETARQTQAALDAGRRCIVYDVPLLVESAHWRSRVDRVLVVDCETQTQIERTIRRSGLTRAAVEGIIAAQASRVQRLHAADIVLYNDGIPLDALERLVHETARRFGL